MFKRLKSAGTVIALTIAGAAVFAPQNAIAVENFNQAKRILPTIYHQLDKEFGQTSTIYCGCPLTYESRGSKKNPYYKFKIDIDECGYQVRKNETRAKRVEVEHVMPAWDFGHQLQCWQEGGRKNCKSNEKFEKMEGDLHNLYPAVGEVNGDRANYQFTDWNGTPKNYGKCEMVIDTKKRQAQPPKASRGQIARAYLYMSETYGIKLSNAQRKLYEAWNRLYPPTEFDCARNDLIKNAQGNDNKYITAGCKVKNK